jgi:hypothetical protein
MDDEGVLQANTKQQEEDWNEEVRKREREREREREEGRRKFLWPK